jgi:hypothetical protein
MRAQAGETGIFAGASGQRSAFHQIVFEDFA